MLFMLYSYKDAGHPQPQLLYTDRGCCNISSSGPSKFSQLFAMWDQLEVAILCM